MGRSDDGADLGHGSGDEEEAERARKQGAGDVGNYARILDGRILRSEQADFVAFRIQTLIPGKARNNPR